MRTELVGLHQPALELGAVGDVVEDHQAADAVAFARNQRRDGDVQRGIAASAVGPQHEFVDVDECRIRRARRFELVAQIGREAARRSLPADGVVARDSGELLDLRVPALHAIVEIRPPECRR